MQKNTRRNIFVAATYAVVLVLGLILGQYYSNEQRIRYTETLDPLGVSNFFKLQEIMELLSTSYVDSLNTDDIEDHAISEILSRLDPYSSYLQPIDADRFSETLEGTFEGVGVEYFNLNDTLLVVSIIPDSPAEKAGFRVGDQLLKIDSIAIAGVQMPIHDIDKLIRGKKGSSAEVFVKRDEYPSGKLLQVTRNQINVSSLDAAYLIRPAVAYIKIRRFGLKTAEEFKVALAELEKRGATSLIVDLRENGGGYFHASIQLASVFFEDKELLVYTQGYHSMRKNYFSASNGAFPEGQLIVLINENTASASEIFAGAIQDLNRGILVGRRSYGKGLVQERFGLPDGSTIHLSVSRYFTPLGRDIQKKNTRNTQEMLVESPLWASDSSSTEGGLHPDLVIPIDSNELNVRYREINASNYTEHFVYERFTKKSPAYSIDNFLQGYHLPDKEYAAFIAYLRGRGMDLNTQQARDLRQLIQRDIEALVGRFYFGRDAYFKVRNREDAFVEAAIKSLSPRVDEPIAQQ